MKAAVRFILLMPWGRVGSNLLFAILRQSAPMKANNEMFNQLRTAAEQEAWLDDFYELGRTHPSQAHIGSKQNILAVRDLAALSRLLAKNAIRVVRLRRENVVKTAISQMRAKQYADKTLTESGVARWAVRLGDEKPGATRLDPDTFLRRISLIESLQQKLMAEFAPETVLDVEYEEINRNISDVVRRTREFLELPQKLFRIPFVKATPDAPSEAVENYAELRECLSGTRWAAQIDG